MLHLVFYVLHPGKLDDQEVDLQVLQPSTFG